MSLRALVVAAGFAVPLCMAACGSPDASSLSEGPGGPSGANLPGASAVSTGAEAGTVTIEPDASGPSPEQVFNELEPALVDACGTCHGVAGTLPAAPKWLVGPDRYKAITTYPGIVVTDVSDSLMLTIGDTVQHAGGPGLSNAPPTHLLDKVTVWLEMEAATIQAIPLPATAPFSIHDGANTVDLSKAGVKGASMGFTAQIEGSLITFSDMTITAPAKTDMHVTHPLFAIVSAGESPVPDVGDSFSNLDQTVPAGQTATLGVGLFVLDVNATIGNDWSTSERLEVEFTTLASATSGDGGTTSGDAGSGGGGCKAVGAFTSDAVPAIQANTCLTCHQGENPTATASLDLTKIGTDNAAACAQALTRVNLMNPTQSAIILAPTGGIPGHPFTGASASFTTKMLDWIAKE